VRKHHLRIPVAGVLAAGLMVSKLTAQAQAAATVTVNPSGGQS